MPSIRQTSLPSYILGISQKRRLASDFIKNPLQFIRRRCTQDVYVNRETAYIRGVQKNAGASLEDEIKAAFLQMPEQGKCMDNPLQDSRIGRLNFSFLPLNPIQRIADVS